MPRSQGFARGDFDTSFPIDDKFLELRHRLAPDRYYAATGVYWHIVAAAWREAERKPAARVCPDAPSEIGDLQSVGLLDSEERLPNRAFLAYVGRAKRQRAKTSDRQRQHREGKSRTSHASSRVTERDTPLVTPRHNPARDQGEDGRGSDTSGEVGPDPRDPADIYWQLTGKYPGEKTLPWIDQLTSTYGSETVIRHLVGAHMADSAASTLLGRTQDLLRAESRQLDKRERDAEEASLKAKRAVPRKLEPWQEEFRQRIQEQYDTLGAA